MVQILLTLICQQKPQKFACRYVVIVTLWYFIHSKFLCIIYFLTNSHSFIVYRVQTERKEKLSKTGRFIFQLLNTYFNRSYIFFKDMLSTEYTFCVTFRVVTKYNNYENSCIEIKKKNSPIRREHWFVPQLKKLLLPNAAPFQRPVKSLCRLEC
jgi:hypothetical protein